MENHLKEYTVCFQNTDEEPTRLMTFDGELICYASKRTNQIIGDASPKARLRLFKNMSEKVRSGKQYILAFERVTPEDELIVASYKTFTSLEALARRSPVDKMHRRICDLAGVRHLMRDMQIDEIGGE